MSRLLWKAMGLTILLGTSAVIGYDAAFLVAGMF
jgi:hypothetical protein